LNNQKITKQVLMDSWNEAYSDRSDESETLMLEGIRHHQLTKPLLQVASKKKLKRGYWVHFLLENGCTVDCIWSRVIP